jgi:hypothetical protein
MCFSGDFLKRFGHQRVLAAGRQTPIVRYRLTQQVLLDRRLNVAAAGAAETPDMNVGGRQTRLA